MQDVIEHPSGLVLSVKTFRPLLIFPWTSAVWRQSPFRTAIATVAYRNKAAAQSGHDDLTRLLRNLQVAPDMSNLFSAVEEYAQQHLDGAVKSYRLYAGHEVEGRVEVRVETPEDDRPG